MVTRRIIVDDDEPGAATILQTQDNGNSAEAAVVVGAPYVARIGLVGTSPILFHRWQDAAVAEKAAAPKGSAAKKMDDLESYVWRNQQGFICLPGEYLRGALCGPQGAAKYRQDPRSPRKSALDLFKAGVVPVTPLAVLTTANGIKAKTWDMVDEHRVTVQRNGITRRRPCFLEGWKATIDLQVLLPQYISQNLLREVLIDAGRFVGVADFRPTYGRFGIESFVVLP